MIREQHGRRLAAVAVSACSLVVAVAVEIGLRTMSLPRLTSLLGIPLMDSNTSTSTTGATAPVPVWARRRLAIVFRIMQRWPFDEKCLRRSLVGACLVRSARPTLSIGVAIIDAEVRAHAWLSINGVDLDPGAAQFSVLQPIARS